MADGSANVSIGAPPPTEMTDNDANNKGFVGFWRIDSDRNGLTAISVNGNLVDGLVVASSDSNTLTDNVVNLGGQAGCWLREVRDG